jgi:predicted TIM-barrel fold metal-dependent hydrolase
VFKFSAHTALACKHRGLKKTVKQYFRDNVWITTSGNFSTPALLCSIMVLGIDKIIFSVDWPYESNTDGASWLKGLPLSGADLEKLAHGNAERLLKIAHGARS